MSNNKILIVDDEPDIIEFLEYNLRKEGFEVFSANNGEEGLRLAEATKPDLIILDIMMPIMDGVEVCRQLRAREAFKSTIITFLTAREEDYSQIAALDMGGDDYITKPIRPRVFISRIKALLRRGPRPGETEEGSLIEIGDLIIDLEKVIVARGDEILSSPKKNSTCLLSWLPSQAKYLLGKKFSTGFGAQMLSLATGRLTSTSGNYGKN